MLAENVANADTPNFRPRDLAPPKFDGRRRSAAAAVASVALARTEPGHIAGIGQQRLAVPHDEQGRLRGAPAGNAVNLEDEMMKVAANQMDYQAATTLYTRSLGLIKTALGKR